MRKRNRSIWGIPNTAQDIKGRYFSYDVNYNNEPDTFTYYFKADSAKAVALATGIEEEYIWECSKQEIFDAMKHRKHIDRVVNNRLVETL